MDSITKHYQYHYHYHSHVPIFSVLLRTQQENNNIVSSQNQPPNNMHSSTSDFPIAIALLALMAVALLVVSYYIFVIKCCLNWHNLDPLRRFSISRGGGGARHNDDSLMAFSPMVEIHRGLDEWLINNIPAFQYKGGGNTDNNNNNNNNNNNSNSNSNSNNNNSNSNSNSNSFRGCAVCLNEFQEQDMLRILPRCSHIFHLDCIDVWLLNNASCPLCRSSISGRTKYPIDHIIAPSSSPQDFSPFHEDDTDYLVIELGSEGDQERSMSRELSTRFPSRVQSQRKPEQQKGNSVSVQNKKARKFQHLSIMGDECINVREKDEQFAIQQPIRRSFSMDSAADSGLYLQVQEIIRQNRTGNRNEASGTSTPHDQESNSNGNGRVRRPSFFSFGHGRGSSRSSSILPIDQNEQ